MCEIAMAPPANLESILMQLQWGDPRCENLELPYAATKHRDRRRQRRDEAASGEEGSALARETETGTRANLAAATRFLASSEDDESS